MKVNNITRLLALCLCCCFTFAIAETNSPEIDSKTKALLQQEEAEHKAAAEALETEANTMEILNVKANNHSAQVEDSDDQGFSLDQKIGSELDYDDKNENSYIQEHDAEHQRSLDNPGLNEVFIEIDKDNETEMRGCSLGTNGYGTSNLSDGDSYTNTCNYAGEHHTATVVEGLEYTFSTCAGSGWDSQLTLYAADGVTELAYSDDSCGALSEIVWTASYSGTAYVMINKYYCTTDSSCHTFTASADSGAAPVPGETCSDPLAITLPYTDSGSTDGWGDDYSSSPCSASYMRGDDLVLEFTLDVDSFLSGSLWSGTYQYGAVHITDDCPDVAASCVAIGGGSSGGSFADVLVAAGTYFATVSNYASPQYIDYDLSLSAVAVVSGCMDVNADNYNVDANVDDGNCEYSLVQGCMDASACNYDEDAQQDDGNCVLPGDSCGCPSYDGTSTSPSTGTWGEFEEVCAPAGGPGGTVTWSQNGAFMSYQVILGWLDCAGTNDIGSFLTSYSSYYSNPTFELAAGECIVWVNSDYYGYGAGSASATFEEYAPCDDPSANNFGEMGDCTYPGATCSDPAALTLPVVGLEGHTDGFDDDYSSSPCYYGYYISGDDIVYTFTLDADSYLSGSVSGSWTGMHITSDCIDTATDCAAEGHGSTGGSFSDILLDAGTYFLTVSTYAAPQSTAYVLNLSAVALSYCEDEAACNTGDLGQCEYAGSSCDCALDGAGAGYIESGDAQWHSVTLGDNLEDATFSLCGSAFDSKIEVWGACDDASWLAYNDDSCGLQSEVSLTNPAAGTYSVKVYGYSSSSTGAYDLVVTETLGSYCGDGVCDDDEACDACDSDCGACCSAGDANDDDVVNVTDIITMVAYILNNIDTIGACADVTGDGAVTVSDIVGTVSLILGTDGRTSDATSAEIIKTADSASLKADGFIGAIQMTLAHGNDFSIDLADGAMVADYKTSDNLTTLIIVNPNGEKLFTTEGTFEVEEVIVANSVGLIDASIVTPEVFGLSSAYPNPFNPTTSVALSLPNDSYVSVMVYNLMGQTVATLADGYMTANVYNFSWDASVVPSGVYFIRAEAGSDLSIQKVMLLK